MGGMPHAGDVSLHAPPHDIIPYARLKMRQSHTIHALIDQWCKGAMILCTMGFLQFCPEGGPLCSVPCLKDLWKKARSPSWSALHSSACWEPIALICGMSVPRRSNIPETFCFPASMI